MQGSNTKDLGVVPAIHRAARIEKLIDAAGKA
jgi:hypothetical protein